MRPLPLQFRQGDVLVTEVTALPDDGKPVPVEKGRVVLAHGELTGHHHSLEASAARMIETAAGERYLQVLFAAPLIHQEHAPITLQPGSYRVTRQREYHPGEIRNVAD